MTKSPMSRGMAAFDIAIVLAAVTIGYIAEMAARKAGLLNLPDVTEGLASIAAGAIAVIALKGRRGQPWTDFGLRRPRRLWTVPSWAVGIVVAFFIVQNLAILVAAQFFAVPAPQLARYLTDCAGLIQLYLIKGSSIG